MRSLTIPCLLSILFTSSALHLQAQIGSNPPIPPSWSQRPGQSPMPNVKGTEPKEDAVDRMRSQQLDKLNARHQDQARSDAAKLLELATALKAQLDGSNNVTVSAKSVADADKIMSLAKSIKGNLRQF